MRARDERSGALGPHERRSRVWGGAPLKYRMPGRLYYVGRGLQLVGMAALLESILIAGPLGPSPRIFGVGIAAFVVGFWLVKRATGH